MKTDEFSTIRFWQMLLKCAAKSKLTLKCNQDHVAIFKGNEFITETNNLRTLEGILEVAEAVACKSK